jgi:hypothetical protein
MAQIKAFYIFTALKISLTWKIRLMKQPKMLNFEVFNL